MASKTAWRPVPQWADGFFNGLFAQEGRQTAAHGASRGNPSGAGLNRKAAKERTQQPGGIQPFVASQTARAQSSADSSASRLDSHRWQTRISPGIPDGAATACLPAPHAPRPFHAIIRAHIRRARRRPPTPTGALCRRSADARHQARAHTIE